MAEACRPNLCTNGTTTKTARKILSIGKIPKMLCTMNRNEARSLMQEIGCREENGLPGKLNAQHVLVTHGAQGFCIHNRDGMTAKYPAVPVPEYTDFIGCGDYATAGAILALMTGLDPGKTIQELIGRKLELNIVPPNPRKLT